jgi:putative holliday junction resolvase
MRTGRYLGLDLGGRRIGVAVSDIDATLARPLETITVTGQNQALKRICELAAEHEAAGIVIGLPLNMSGSSSAGSKEVEEFADKLRRLCPVPIYFEDERLSSRQAEAVLHSYGKKIKGNKDKIDRISAAIILQSFLDRPQKDPAN